MSNFSISTPDQVSPFEKASELVNLIENEWANDKLTVKKTDYHDHTVNFSWALEQDDRRSEVYYVENKHLIIDGYLEDAAVFATWYRSKVPQEIELVFYDDAATGEVLLSENTAQSDIIQTFEA